MTSNDFAAIDFETADEQPDSACSVAIVRVKNGEIADRVYRLIKPPRERIVFTYIHGLTWNDLKDQPPFSKVWPEIAHILEGAKFIAAHNSGFDRNVLKACCEKAGIEMPKIRFRCTVQLSRKTWKLPSNRLSAVCQHLNIPLNHHNALSDAEASAKIVLMAEKSNVPGSGPDK